VSNQDIKPAVMRNKFAIAAGRGNHKHIFHFCCWWQQRSWIDSRPAQ